MDKSILVMELTTQLLRQKIITPEELIGEEDD
jgi:hypothetical protein